MHSPHNNFLRFRTLAIASVILIPGLVTGCSATNPATGQAAGGNSTGGTLEKVQSTGILRVALANEPPAAIANADGTLTGVEVEVLRQVTKDIGVKTLEGAITPFESMIPGLLAQRWDVIAAGLNMKKSRCEQALFSEPVIVSTQSFAVKTGNPKNLTSVASLKADPSIVVAILPGSFEESILSTAGVPKSQIVFMQDIRGGLEAVAAGRADAYVSPTLGLKEVAKTSPGIDVTAPLTDAPKTGSGVVFRKEDAVFRDKFNEGLAALKATPRYQEILDQWGFKASDVKGVTSEELCKVPG